MSLGLACNFYREPFALPGFLEMATSGYFDDVVMVSSPPSDAKPDDESIAQVEKAGVRLVHTVIDGGYGVVRTRCIRESQADWVMILDADERFSEMPPLLRCHGTEGYPQVKTPDLKAEMINPSHPQGQMLKDALGLSGSKNAYRLSRRHWFGAPGDFTKPCQNWHRIQDWQLRLVRNSPFIFYDPTIKLHEKLLDSRGFTEPSWGTGDEHGGPFIEHHHHFHKTADPEGRELAIQTYELLDKTGTQDMWRKTGFNDTP